MASDNYCFACGKDNPIGLHLIFSFDGEKITAKKRLAREFQGYEGAAHGGIVSTMLDDAMCKFVTEKFCEKAVTGRLEIRYKFPTPVENDLKITAWQENQRKNIISMRSTVETAEGLITAEATAKFALVKSS